MGSKIHKMSMFIVVIGVFFMGVSSYVLWQEVSVLRERDKYYESILSTRDAPDPMELITHAKNFFALQPNIPNRDREKKVLALYESALGHWVALNAVKPDDELNPEITAFQKTAQNLRKE